MTVPVRDRPPPYSLVVFDCDSTLSAIEGIEELAAGRTGELRRLTDLAMEGVLPLEEVYGRRLELVRPTRAAVEGVGRRYVETALPHAAELVRALAALEKRVAIVSGGLRPPVLALAERLGVPAADVHAVDVSFDGEGRYADFDRASPLARSGGKLEVLRRLAAESGPAVLVGDGATDLEAAPAVDRFVAFGGVVRREGVFAAARVSSDRPDLAALLPLLLAPGEIERLRASPGHSALVEAAGVPLPSSSPRLP